MNKLFVLTGSVFVLGAMMNQFTVRAATIAERLDQYGASARSRLSPHFKQAGVAYPPEQLVFVGLKAEKTLQVYAKSGTNGYRFVRSYPILAASGVAGPKLREGDRQVPEGIYAIELLNPNSSYHLSLRVSYPNAFDREQAAKEQRTTLGGDIMIHGKAVSIGCLAMGDEAAEDLFVLAADCGITNIAVILSPVDFRAGKSVPDDAKLPPWTTQLYQEIKTRLAELPLPKEK
jgi:murein L,D-transpeptidase YafK